MTCCLQRQSERLITAAPRARKLPYGTTAESSLMFAGAIRPLAGIVKSFSDLVISESYRWSEHALPDSIIAWSRLAPTWVATSIDSRR